ncbi:MAG: cbb3-type cytochrome c oxidase subunit 3 [Pseudomonadales bacterium]
MSAAEFSLLAVTVSFLGLVVWVYWPGRRGRLESYGRMPMEDEAADEKDRRGDRR